MVFDLEAVRNFRKKSTGARWSSEATSASVQTSSSLQSCDSPASSSCSSVKSVFLNRDFSCDDAQTSQGPCHAHLVLDVDDIHESVPLSRVLSVLSTEQRWTCVRQLIVGLFFLHNEGIFHGNVTIDSVVALRDLVEGEIDAVENTERNDGSDWVFKWLLPLSCDSTADDSEVDAVAFGKLALDVLQIDDAGREDLLSWTCSKQSPSAMLRWLAQGGSEDHPPILDAAIVESVLGVENVWTPLLDHATARATMHRGLSLIRKAGNEKAEDRKAAAEAFQSTLQRDPFLRSARILFEMAAWTGKANVHSPRNAIVSLLRACISTPHANGELAFSLLRAGWLAESWGFAMYSLQKLDTWQEDWQSLASRISEHEAMTVGICPSHEIFKSLAKLLPVAKRIDEGSLRLLQRELERCCSEAVEKLSRLPFWPILLPPEAAIEAARVGSKRCASKKPPWALSLLWHLAATLQTTLKHRDAVTHLICSWPAKYSSLGIHIVQPSGIIIWAEGGSTTSVAETLESSPFSTQIGASSCGLLMQQRLMIFANSVLGDDGYDWDTYALRFSNNGGGIIHSTLIEGSPPVLLVVRADNSFDRFVLSTAQHGSTKESSMRPSFLLNLMSGARSPSSPKGTKEAISSSTVTLDSLLLGLHMPTARTSVSPKPLGFIPVSDASQFLVPLRFDAADIRVLVLEHSKQPLGYTQPPPGSAIAPAEIYIRAQQLHVLSISKLPLNPATRKMAADEQVRQPTLAETHQRHTIKSKFASAVTSGLVIDGGLKGFITATALSSHLHTDSSHLHTKIPSSPASAVTLPADPAFFFLPHIWELVLCLHDQLFWWTLPYPLSDRAGSGGAVSATKIAAALAAGADPSLAAGTGVHYRVELPFIASHWQLASQRARLLALVRRPSFVSGHTSNAGSVPSIPNYIAVLDAWYGDILRMIHLPDALLGAPPHFPHSSHGSRQDWKPSYRLRLSNNIVVVTIGGRVSFWSLSEIVNKSNVGQSRAKMKNVLKRVSALRTMAKDVRESVNAEVPVAIQHHVISSGGRDGWCRADAPKTTRVPPASTTDMQCFAWRECLLLSGISIWSTGSSLHVMFHEDGENVAQKSFNAAEKKKASLGPQSTWVAVSHGLQSAPSLPSDPLVQEKADAKSTTANTKGPVAAFASLLMQTKRNSQVANSSASKTASISHVETPGSVGAHLEARAISAASGALADRRKSMKEMVPARSRRRALQPNETGHEAVSSGMFDNLSATNRKLSERIMRYIAVEHSPSATWLVEAFAVVTSALAELRGLLHPGNPDSYLKIASALEACCRVASPLQHVLGNELQEMQRYLAECVGCMGVKAWGTMHFAREYTSCIDAGLVSATIPMTDHIPPQVATSGADLRAALVISSRELPTRVAALALDAHGRQMLLVVEGAAKGTDRWAIEFWRVTGSAGAWSCLHSAYAHTSMAPPCCALSESAVIGFTAAECIFAWDSDDAEQLFCLKWADTSIATAIWCSGDGARVAISTSTSIYYWRDRVLSHAVDCRAIIALSEQGSSRTAGREGQSALGQRQLTSGHCAFSADGSGVFGGVVDMRWLAIIFLKHQGVGTKSTAFVLTSPSREISDLWVSASGVTLLLFPEKLEIWTLPLRPHIRRMKRQSVWENKEHDPADVISRGQALHGPIEEALESLAGGPPEIVVSMASKKWIRTVAAVLPVQRFLTFNESSRLLVCWDAGASAAVAFVLPISHSAAVVLEPQWATTLPAFGSIRIAAADAGRADLVLLGASTKWTLWRFSVNICNVIMTSCTPASVEEPDASQWPVSKRRLKQRRSKHVRISNKRQAALDCAQARELMESSYASKWFGSAVSPPLLPASHGRCLRPSTRWLAITKSKTVRKQQSAKRDEIATKAKPEVNAKFVVTFQPGKIGVYDDGCVVLEVKEGGQAERKGVMVGWRIVSIGDQKCQSFDDKLFQDAQNGNVPFQVTFEKAAEIAECQAYNELEAEEFLENEGDSFLSAAERWELVAKKFGFVVGDNSSGAENNALCLSAAQRWELVAKKFGFAEGDNSSGAENNAQVYEDDGEDDDHDEDDEVAKILAANPCERVPMRSASAKTRHRSPPLSCTTFQRFDQPPSIQQEHPCTLFAGHRRYLLPKDPRHHVCNAPRGTKSQRSVYSRLGISPIPPRESTSPEGRLAASGNSSSKSSRSPSPAPTKSENARFLESARPKTAQPKVQAKMQNDWREQLLSARFGKQQKDAVKADGVLARPATAPESEKTPFIFIGHDGRTVSPVAFPPSCVSPRMRIGALGANLKYFPRQ